MKRHRPLRLLLLALIVAHMLEWFTEGPRRVEHITLAAELFIAVFLVFVDVIWPVGSWAKRRWRLARTFALSLPGGNCVPIVSGRDNSTPLLLSIHISNTTVVGRFHLKLTNSE